MTNVTVTMLSDASLNFGGDNLTMGASKTADVEDFLVDFFKTQAEAGHIKLEIGGKEYKGVEAPPTKVKEEASPKVEEKAPVEEAPKAEEVPTEEVAEKTTKKK